MSYLFERKNGALKLQYNQPLGVARPLLLQLSAFNPVSSYNISQYDRPTLGKANNWAPIDLQ